MNQTVIDTFKAIINQFCADAFAMSSSKGFWDNPRNKGEMIALMHSELSEALEGIRKPGTMSDKIPTFTPEEEELADLLIRVFDYCGGHNVRLADAVIAKLEYNSNRPHKHGKAF